jgi:hypothetical protein
VVVGGHRLTIPSKARANNTNAAPIQMTASKASVLMGVDAELESDDVAADGDRVVIQEQLQAAIAALQEIDIEL